MNTKEIEKNFENAMEGKTKVLSDDEKIKEIFSDLKNLAFVRMEKDDSNIEKTRYGSRVYASPIRPTIHFTINGPVPNHMYGNWDDSNVAIITPLVNTLKENAENFIGGTLVDMYFLGHVKLPKNAIILHRKKGESAKKFRERIKRTLEEHGYTPVAQGMWSVFSGPTADAKIKEELFKKISELNKKPENYYYIGTHWGSIFYEVQNKVLKNYKTKEEMLNNYDKIEDDSLNQLILLLKNKKTYISKSLEETKKKIKNLEKIMEKYVPKEKIDEYLNDIRKYSMDVDKNPMKFKDAFLEYRNLMSDKKGFENELNLYSRMTYLFGYINTWRHFWKDNKKKIIEYMKKHQGKL